jgi:hypothetical protein
VHFKRCCRLVLVLAFVVGVDIDVGDWRLVAVVVLVVVVEGRWIGRMGREACISILRV